tara:strand:+ start:1867 stop:2613 length:747 start_codon:yes stop_codon:yes gene_type:complete
MKISVITICLNSEKTIEKTIKSVLEQKYENIEYIVIDGGSSDKTLNILHKYRSKISKVTSEKDKGIYDAINKGIKLSTGEIVSVLHSDDYYYNSDVLNDVVSFFSKEKEIDCLIGTTIMIRNNKILRKYSPKNFKKWMMYLGISPPHPSSFFKRKVYDICGLYNINYKIAGDFDFFLRTLFKKNIYFKKIGFPFVIMQYGGKSTQSLKNNLISSKEILRSFKENNLYNTSLLIYLRFPIKLMQFIFKK